MADRQAAQGGSLSLIIPAFNEEAGIATAIAEADDVLAALSDEYEILVVDDGSRDATFAVASKAARNRPQVRVLRHPQNRGYGAALRTGFEAARLDHVAFTDADCQFHLADLSLLTPLLSRYPVVVGYRLDRQDPPRRRFLSWGYNVLARTLLGTGVRDVDCALKVFRREALVHLLPEAPGFFVNTEMLSRARQLGFEVAEVGVRHRPRLRGSSKVSLGDIPKTLATLLPFWWSQVLFPLAAHSSKARVPRRTAGPGLWGLDFGLWTILLAAALLFFGRIGSPLQEPQESRYAEIPRQMLAEGRWLVPVLHGQSYFDKPPLLYWLVMASYRTLGIHDWAARLVPCTAGFLCVVIAYLWGRRTVGARAAFAGALVLCLSVRFVQLERMLTMDGVLCLWVTAALAAAHIAVSRPSEGAEKLSPPGGARGGNVRWRWWLVSAAACALGLLTKGPVALVLVVAPVLALQVLDWRVARPRWREWALYVGVALGLAAPWFLAVTILEPTFVDYFFWDHNVVRFLTPFDHEEPFWFYLPGLLLGMLPWSFLLPGLGRFLWRHATHTAGQRPPALGFFLLSALWCLTFFSLSGCKRPGYILPVFPPLALALGCYVDALISADPRKRGLIFTGRRAAWGVCAAATFLVLLGTLHEGLPGYARRFSLRGQVRRYADASPGPVACYPHRWDSVNFYLQRDDIQVYTPEERDRMMADLQRSPATLVFVKSDRWLNDLTHHLPASLEFVPEGRQGFVTVGWVRSR